MNGQQLFEQLIENLLRIGPSEKNLVFYQEIQKSLLNVNVIDHFYQLKKNDKGAIPSELQGKKVILWSWDNLEKFINQL
jgi:hypothetical protein